MTVIRYNDLFTSFQRGLRNGNRRHLNRSDNALFQASLWYAKHRGRIVNTAVVEKLIALAEWLNETKCMKIFRRGFNKAPELLKKGDGKVFAWAPHVKEWLEYPDYTFWLGTVR